VHWRVALKACQTAFPSFYHHGGSDRKPPVVPAKTAAIMVIVEEVGYTPINREQYNLFFRLVANRIYALRILAAASRPLQRGNLS
jgi:hypothetical protein